MIPARSDGSSGKNRKNSAHPQKGRVPGVEKKERDKTLRERISQKKKKKIEIGSERDPEKIRPVA